MAGVDPAEADVIMRAAQQLVSLDRPARPCLGRRSVRGPDPGRELGLPVRRGGRESMRDERLKACLDNLPYRDKRIIELRFGLGDDEKHTLDKGGVQAVPAHA